MCIDMHICIYEYHILRFDRVHEQRYALADELLLGIERIRSWVSEESYIDICVWCLRVGVSRCGPAAVVGRGC